jgi:hypothetical protein
MLLREYRGRTKPQSLARLKFHETAPHGKAVSGLKKAIEQESTNKLQQRNRAVLAVLLHEYAGRTSSTSSTTGKKIGNCSAREAYVWHVFWLKIVVLQPGRPGGAAARI